MEELLQKILEQWDEILLTTKETFKIQNASFDAFLVPLTPYTIVNDTLYILNEREQNKLALKFLKNKYGDPLSNIITDTIGKELNVEFLLASDTTTMDFENPTTLTEPTDYDYKESHLNPKYTFDTFVVGDSNRFAQTAALAVSESPGEAYNPLYIYGGPGLGKTHLMHSIGNYIINQSPDKKILYVTSEEFINEVIESIRSVNNVDSMSKLRDKYRSVDVLMIDDIQFIIGKESTQNEFFHTFNTLHQSEKQIVISSDRPPREMETLETRISSRFEMGLMADIGNPDYETRMAILRKKLENFNVPIGDDILSYIAENIKSNVREIEGALNKLIALYNLEKKEITLDIAVLELKNIISPSKNKEITPQHIIEVVADHYNITVESMCSLKKNREISKPRQIAMYLCREMTDYAFKSIGSFIGGKDHATVIHGVKKIETEFNDDPAFHAEIEYIKKKISQNN